jgi:cardiolipin synthase
LRGFGVQIPLAGNCRPKYPQTGLFMKNQIPNLLTLSRIIVIPALVASFYIDGPVGNWIGFALFAFAGVTDFFDGYLARSMNVVSPLGRFLDPIADKLLVVQPL